ncbi:MAG: ATP-binding cassette domain-containing protein [Gammaproteobacteria bacterium]|nr:ATP-binding cassette domain-containing protein [Rhodocyclaceae bacterium]MBU3908496.1 ATP-binding cassette domain-containing protein [Gammaproteobacteria bacterium]MBU3988621.1 ATP-binding cassette domain-containing protein [Gammaproteobacteria bacterium]MBU4004524.1 ATP-binding cassette domain-containing protein [Gammaproteobacteria bacterium]MBU4021127.1 ATP-binding cassette domain-containing protein [Gammaproteobacteria bacterium]
MPSNNRNKRVDNRVMTEMVLQVEGLGKDVISGTNATGGDRILTILHEIDFNVQAGEAVAVVGASGSGKSTLLGLLAGLDLPTRGRVQLAGQDLAGLDEDGRAALRGRELGFVFQSFHLLAALTALENVMLPLELLGSQFAPDPRSIAEAMLARVGLADRLGHYPKHLSGGEQQRVALARAFAVSPRLLLADEPTGNLDAATGQQVIDLMFEMNAEQGTTLILVTHDESLAGRCGRIIRLAAGRLA